MSAPPLSVDYVSDWVSRLVGRLYEQFKNTTTWPLWAQLLGRQFNDLETAFQSLFAVLSINDAAGAQLDLIGRIVGQAREGLGDVAYRCALRARVLANRSNGTPEELYAVVDAFLGLSAAQAYLHDDDVNGTKEFVLRVLTPVDNSLIPILLDLFGDAKDAGARGLLQWQPAPNANTFRFAGPTTVAPGSGFGVGVLAGVRQA